MKVAICFSGQIRTAIESSPNLLRFFGDSLTDCDFFIHTWDINSTKGYNGLLTAPIIEKISEDSVNKVIDIYKPKKIIIEEYDNFRNEYPKRNGSLAEHWYSFMKSVEIKHEYEKENNFIYDYVIKLRFDVIFPPTRRLIDDINLLEENEFYIENYMNDGPLWSDDIYFISNSENMDKSSTYFKDAYKKYIDYPDEFFYFTRHISNQGVKLTSCSRWGDFHVNDFSYGIYRKECLEFSPLDDYENCFFCDHHYFDGNVNVDKEKTYYVNELKKYIKR